MTSFLMIRIEASLSLHCYAGRDRKRKRVKHATIQPPSNRCKKNLSRKATEEADIRAITMT